ncbi:MAG: dihydroneopterin aldolase [Synergistaceae bacterium]|jgi:dihydroneopterin aldolase|nr:dihydroneopterin aldolase [Synergistaceae bacterium]
MKSRHAVRGMSFHAFHGVQEVERELGQVFSVDVVVEFDVNPGDDVPNAEPLIRDAAVYEITRNVMTETKYRSLTSLAEKIARDIFASFAKITGASVSIRKKQLFIPGNVDSTQVDVECSREDFAG